MKTPNFNKNEQPKFLRWAGSKARMIPSIMPLVPEFGRYIEPFCGSCALFFSLAPGKAILSDVNPALIKTLNAVRNHPTRVFDALVGLKWSEASYYSLRKTALSESNEIQLAANFIFLNANCFTGRENVWSIIVSRTKLKVWHVVMTVDHKPRACIS